MSRSIQTNYAVPLSEFIEEILEEAETPDLDALASKMGDDVAGNKAVLDIIMEGKTPLTLDAATRLCTATKVPADYWMRLDALYWDDAKRLGLV